MTITESIPFESIKSQISKEDKVEILSCNGCARMCGTGGVKALEKIKEKLKKDGIQTADTSLIGIICIGKFLKSLKLQGDKIVVLACDAGIHNFKKFFPNKKVVRGLNTVGLGTWNKDGRPALIKKF